MDEMLGSECSSGCESGWTLYLDQSFLSHRARGNDFEDGVYSQGKRHEEEEEEEEEEDEVEDLSMVSDASSGPPIFHENEYYGNAVDGCFYSSPIETALPKNRGNKKMKTRENHPTCLDDTASSPFFNNNLTLTKNHQASMENTLEFSEGCSATHFEGRSAFLEPYGFFHSPLSTNKLQQNQWFGG